VVCDSASKIRTFHVEYPPGYVACVRRDRTTPARHGPRRRSSPPYPAADAASMRYQGRSPRRLKNKQTQLTAGNCKAGAVAPVIDDRLNSLSHHDSSLRQENTTGPGAFLRQPALVASRSAWHATTTHWNLMS
jgi:hypothetical protein